MTVVAGVWLILPLALAAGWFVTSARAEMSAAGRVRAAVHAESLKVEQRAAERAARLHEKQAVAFGAQRAAEQRRTDAKLSEYRQARDSALAAIEQLLAQPPDTFDMAGARRTAELCQQALALADSSLTQAIRRERKIAADETAEWKATADERARALVTANERIGDLEGEVKRLTPGRWERLKQKLIIGGSLLLGIKVGAIIGAL